MRRRSLLAAFSATALWPLATVAQQPERIRLSEILVSTQKASPAPQPAKPAVDPAAPPADASAAPPPAKPADPPAADPAPAPAPSEAELVANAEAKAKSLREQIAKGTAFEDVAKKSSDGPSASQGGDLGYFERGKLSKELEDMQMRRRVVLFRTKQGFVILKVAEHEQAGVPTLKQVEPRIQDALYYQKLQPALRAYLTKLREDAFIDIRPGYVDSGASPNQTKPVETATKEASAKNLKKKKKFGVF